VLTIEQFRERCREQGVPITRQREVIYETLLEMDGHPSLDELYATVRAKDASLSLATVYNNVRKFLDCGLLREVSPVHGGMRIEANDTPHHHVICTVCQSVSDLEAPPLESIGLEHELRKFTVHRINVDILGVCADCKTNSSKSKELR
jgi:Fur family peroxide stress response transcriptional regulator